MSHLEVLSSVTTQEAPLTSESLCGSAPMQSLLDQREAAQAARSTPHHPLVSAQNLHCKNLLSTMALQHKGSPAIPSEWHLRCFGSLSEYYI